MKRTHVSVSLCLFCSLPTTIDKVLTLPCDHEPHSKCLWRAIEEGKKNCPVCKKFVSFEVMDYYRYCRNDTLKNTQTTKHDTLRNTQTTKHKRKPFLRYFEFNSSQESSDTGSEKTADEVEYLPKTPEQSSGYMFRMLLNRDGRCLSTMERFVCRFLWSNVLWKQSGERDVARIESFVSERGLADLADAVVRAWVFLSLNPTFEFTNVKDFLHRCPEESVGIFQWFMRPYRVYLSSYQERIRKDRDFPHNLLTYSIPPSPGNPYDFFGLKMPRIRTESSNKFEQDFGRVVKDFFGVCLPASDVDGKLSQFYKRRENCLHDVLKFARLKEEQSNIELSLKSLEEGYSGCRVH